MNKKECMYKNNKIINSVCFGKMFECKNYFINGKSAFTCENHKSINPSLNWKMLCLKNQP